MIFKNFCEREMINPYPFLRFCLLRYRTGEQIINSTGGLELAWKEFLAVQYMIMLAKLEAK